MLPRKFVSRIWVFNKEKQDWVPFSVMYGTMQDNLKWLLLRDIKTSFDGTEVRLDKGTVVYAEPLKPDGRIIAVFNADGTKNIIGENK